MVMERGTLIYRSGNRRKLEVDHLEGPHKKGLATDNLSPKRRVKKVHPAL